MTTNPLINTSWRVIAGLKNLDSFAVTAEFDKRIVSGFSGCNNYWGNYEIDGRQLRLMGALAGTRKMCSEQQMSLEAEFLDHLTKMSGFHLNGDQLELNSEEGKTLFTLRRTGVEDLLGKWQVLSIHIPERKAIVSVSDSLDLTFEKGFVHGNAGCNTFKGTWVLEGRMLNFGPLNTTLKECEENVMIQKKALLDALNSVVSWRLAGDHISLLRADGGIAVSLLRLNANKQKRINISKQQQSHKKQ